MARQYNWDDINSLTTLNNICYREEGIEAMIMTIMELKDG